MHVGIPCLIPVAVVNQNSVSIAGIACIGSNNSSRSGGKALLWSDGEIDTLGFRGVVTGIYVLKRNREEEAETIRTTRPTEGRNHIFTPN